MGAQWHFGLREDSLVPVTVCAPILHIIARYTGLVLRRYQIPLDSYYDEITESILAGDPVIVYGDSILMPWLPYFGYESAPHPTIVDGISDDGSEVHIVEAYTNKTPNGAVVPRRTTVSRREFDLLLKALPPEQRGEVIAYQGRCEPDPVDPKETLRANAEAILQSGVGRGEFCEFAARGRAASRDAEAMARFDLGCWEMTRARSCHAVWLARLAAASPELISPALAERFAAEVAEPWKRVSQFAFLAHQRVLRGSPPPPTSFEMLERQIPEAETQFATALLDHLEKVG